MEWPRDAILRCRDPWQRVHTPEVGPGASGHMRPEVCPVAPSHQPLDQYVIFRPGAGKSHRATTTRTGNPQRYYNLWVKSNYCLDQEQAIGIPGPSHPLIQHRIAGLLGAEGNSSPLVGPGDGGLRAHQRRQQEAGLYVSQGSWPQCMLCFPTGFPYAQHKFKNKITKEMGE